MRGTFALLAFAASAGLAMPEASAQAPRNAEAQVLKAKQSLTGHGHAAKGQMQRAVQSVFNLKDPPEPPDVADALAVALCCGLQLTSEPARRTEPQVDPDLDAVESE